MKTVIITGGNRGLGYYCALEIAKNHNYQIIMASRSSVKNNIAISKIIHSTGNKNIKGYSLNLADWDSIRSFCNQLQADGFTNIDVLINNAGIQYISPTKYTKQGIELTFGLNHLGPFLLTHYLLPHINSDGRILNVSSGVHDPLLQSRIEKPNYTTGIDLAYPKIDNNQNWERVGTQRYSTSKLCNLLFTYKLNSLLMQNDSKITVNAFDPGMMPGTGLADDYKAWQKFAWKYIMPIITLFKKGVNTPATSGRNLAWLATSNELKNTSGKYFVGKTQISSSVLSYDKNLQNDLWDSSLSICQITNLKQPLT